MRAHLSFLFGVTLLGAILTLGPLQGRRPAGALFYFSALGLAYLFVELSVLQKARSSWGTRPTRPPSPCCRSCWAAALGRSGRPGSYCPPEEVARRAALLLVPALLLLHPMLRVVFGVLLGGPFATRVAVLGGLLFPLGFLMGIPFPSGLRALRPRGEEALAWAIGVNAFASVIGSLVAVPVAMFSGSPWWER
jgi:hypothetical protein